MNPQDLQKYGIQLFQLPDGTFLLSEKGGYGQASGVSSVDPSVAKQLISQGVQPVTVTDAQNNAESLSNTFGINAYTGKGNITSLQDLQNKITNGYVAGEANQTASKKMETDAAAYNANPANAQTNSYAGGLTPEQFKAENAQTAGMTQQQIYDRSAAANPELAKANPFVTPPVSAGQTTGDRSLPLYGQPITLPNGQVVSPQDPNYATYAQQMGISSTGTGTAEAAPFGMSELQRGPGQGTTQTPYVPAGAGDMSNWPPQLQEAYNAVKAQMDTLAAQGKRINPNITIDQSTIDRFLTQAKSEVDPYYSQLISQAQSDLNKALTRTSEDYATKERQLGQTYGKNLESTQESFARRGLNFSSDRTKAENILATDTNQALTAAQQEAQRSAQDAGTPYERKLGSSFLPDTSGATIGIGAQAMTGTPGVYGLSSANQSRQLFNPTPDTFGTLQADQITAEKTRQNDLINSERQLRSENYL